MVRFGPCGEQLLSAVACELLGDHGELVQRQMFLHGHSGFGRNIGHLFGIKDAVFPDPVAKLFGGEFGKVVIQAPRFQASQIQIEKNSQSIAFGGNWRE